MTRRFIPNATQIPDVVLDYWMAVLSGAELKVLLYVARRTYGFGKDSDTISLNQLADGMRRRDGSPLNLGTGLSRSGVKVACNSLIEKGLLIRTTRRIEGSREADESVYRINLYASLPDGIDPESGPTEGVEEVGQNLAYLGQKKAYVGQKDAGGGPEIGPQVGQNLAPQEDTTRNTSTAAPAPDGAEAGGADAGLVSELVTHGVGRSVAERLAAEKPEVCRRYIGYLPFAKIRSSPGAWLASAIEQEFGPPEGFLRASAKQAPKAGKRVKATERPVDERIEATLGRRYAEVVSTNHEASAAFSAHVASDRSRAERIAETLSPKRREEYLARLQSEEHRLELLGRWLEGEGRKYRPEPGRSESERPLDVPATV